MNRFLLKRSRVHGARRAIRARADSAKRAAEIAQSSGHVQLAASLRGKARAFQEADEILRRLEEDAKLPSKRRDRKYETDDLPE